MEENEKEDSGPWNREEDAEDHNQVVQDCDKTSNCRSQHCDSSADDPMLGFLTLLAKVERPTCANCESKDVSPMFYCNTCGQAICSVCKNNTHSAKMFSRHDISSVSPYTREPQRKCPVHHEVCIMFSPANESLLCINCFRDLPPDIRAQCLDLDTAYTQKCERLHKGLKAVGELEVTIKDEASAYRCLLKELQINTMREESTIHVFSKILQGVITQTEERLIEAVKRELQSKEMMFEEKLSTLESLQSNVQAYLTLSTAFINSASKYELLKLANGLVERLSDIGAVVQPSKISPENSCISSNFKTEFSQSLQEMFHQEMWMKNLIDVNLPPVTKIEERIKLKNGSTATAPAPVENKETIPAKKKTPPLPFLGRSQSLLNIPLNLDLTEVHDCNIPVRNSNREAPKSPPIATASPPRRVVTKRREVSPKSQSLPKEHKKSNSHRSKSVDASQHLKSPHYDVSQVELFATIQSRKAVNRGDNKVLVTSLMGVRKSDEKKKEAEKYRTAPAPSSSNKNPSGHLCVVQAMVHQDGNTKNPGTETLRKERRVDHAAQRGHQWEPFYEPLTAMRKGEHKGQLESESSIELTADQVRELIKAISAAQNNIRHEKTAQVPAAIPNKQVAAEPRKENNHRPPLHKNDSFEGHEEAVRMLVDAVREIQQICTSKGTCEQF